MATRSKQAAIEALGSGGAGGGAERLWYHDWRLDGDANYNASPLTTIDGLSVAMSSTGVWGPDSGLGMVIAAGATGQIKIEWADVGTDLMARALTHGDTLVFEVQHALASNSLTGAYSSVLGQAQANTPTERTVFGGLFRVGATNRQMRLWSAGWPPGNVVLSDNYAGYRSTSHWVRTGLCETFCSTSELSADSPLSGMEGPFQFGPEFAYSKDLRTSSYWDFLTASGSFRFFQESVAGETAPVIMEAASIWLIPGSPNE